MEIASTMGAERGTYEVRHRNPLAKDYVIVSAVVLIGYPQVSDGAKLTYWVIYSYDWYDPELGRRKGYAFPTVKRLAELRHSTERTIQNHLAELISAALLTRELRPGKPSILYVEEPAQEEIGRYLQAREQGGEKIFRGSGEKNFTPTNIMKNKQDKAINGVKKIVMEENADRQSDWQPVAALLRNSPRLRNLAEDEWLAGEIVRLTADPGSIGCYRTIARSCPSELIFEALSLLKEAHSDGAGLKNRGGFFASTVRKLCQERRRGDPLGRPAPDERRADGPEAFG